MTDSTSTLRPNILFIMTDHTNAQALAPGSHCLTPNLDRLATEGMRFARCTTPNAICSPARASLMTGLYPSSHGMWDCTHTQRREWQDVPAERFTYFSAQLARAGYHNGYFGKWHVEQSEQLEDFGWHEYDLNGNSRGSAGPDNRIEVSKPGYRDYLLAGQSESETPHPAFDNGIDFIQRATQSNKPFCCFVSTAEPHDPYIPYQTTLAQYDLDHFPLSPSLHDEPTDKPEVVARMRMEWAGLSDADWRRVTASYCAVITEIDAEVGRIIDILKEAGQYDNTIIVFTSDHGDMQGGHGMITKGVGTAYEEVYNIPLIIRTPGMAGGVENHDTLTSLVDLGPTLLDLCQADPLPDAQGKSLRPVLEDQADPDDWSDAYAEFFGQRFVYTQRITWHKNWKYIFSPGGIDELYDLANDPHEQHNLAADPDHRDTLIAMCRRMWLKMKAIGDDSLFNSHYATLRTAPVGPGVADEC